MQRWAYEDIQVPATWEGWIRYHNGKTWHYYKGGKTLCGIECVPVQTRDKDYLPRKYYRECKKCLRLIKDAT